MLPAGHSKRRVELGSVKTFDQVRLLCGVRGSRGALCYFLREKWRDLNNRRMIDIDKNKKSLTKTAKRRSCTLLLQPAVIGQGCYDTLLYM
jgi:hypothetical protein